MRTYTLLTAFLLFGLCQAQFLTLTDEDGNVVNSTVFHRESMPSNVTDTVSFYAELNGASATSVNVRRYELNVVPGTQNYYCWGVCYLETNSGAVPVWSSQHNVFMSPGVPVSNFHAYYKPAGQAGAAGFRFVWFDEGNPTDTAWVDIWFGGTVGVEENREAVVTFDAFPNPSIGSDVQIRYALEGAGETRLSMYNAVGERVMQRILPTTNGRATIQTGTLPSGVYFVNLERNGRMVATKRLIVGAQ